MCIYKANREGRWIQYIFLLRQKCQCKWLGFDCVLFGFGVPRSSPDVCYNTFSHSLIHSFIRLEQNCTFYISVFSYACSFHWCLLFIFFSLSTFECIYSCCCCCFSLTFSPSYAFMRIFLYYCLLFILVFLSPHRYQRTV